MMSRLAFRAGALSPIATANLHKGAAIWMRLASTGVSQPDTAAPPPAAPEKTVNSVEDWDRANKLYFGPDRDHVNFPLRRMPLTNPPVRLGFIPETWFQLFYDKTGVTGPYVLGVGMITFLLSKEIWIVEHSFSHFLGFWMAVYLITKKYGKTIANYLDSTSEALEERTWFKPLKKIKANSTTVIANLEDTIWREDGQKYLYESKRENVDLQLESIYRQRLSEVHQNVKKRLDYQLDVETAERRVQQEHMVRWIVDSVVKGITPQQERDSLTKCIQDLKGLAAKSAAA